MDLVTTKIFVAVTFGIWRFFFGILPVKLDKFLRKWEEASTDSNTFINPKRHHQVTCAVAYTQSFGGGVMFATCFLHMMKELYFSVEEIKLNRGINSEYPVSQLVISLGFFFIYFLEEFTHWVVNNAKRRECPSSALDKVASAIIKPNKSSAGSARSASSSKVTPTKTIETIEEWTLNEKNTKLSTDFQNEDAHSVKSNYSKNFLTSPSKTDNAFSRTASAKSRHSIKEGIDRANSAALKELDLTPEEKVRLKDQEQLMRCVLTIAALSLHSILEGLSIGIQKFKSEIWYLFVAVSIHSASILFVMGVELILAQTRVRFIVFQMAALALASPVGIILGLLVTVKTSMKTSSFSVASVILEGLSAGTILYVTFFEVLNREKERRICRFQRCLCIIAGFSLMAILQFSECKFGKHENLNLGSKDIMSLNTNDTVNFKNVSVTD